MKSHTAIYKELLPTLEQLEVNRAAVRKKQYRIIIISSIVVLLLIALLIITFGEFGSLGQAIRNNRDLQQNLTLGIPIFIVIFILIIAWIYARLSDQLTATYKNDIITKVIQAMHPSFQYFPKGYLGEQLFRASHLFFGYDQYKGEDLIRGKIDKTDFQFSEVHAERVETDEEGHTTYTTIFKGVFMMADFHKHFKGHTVVVPDRKATSWIARMFGIDKVAGKKLAKMENPTFERLFDVYTNDQVEARYILSPKMQEAIVQLQRQLSAPIRLAFLHSNVYITAGIKYNILEPNLDELATSLTAIQRYVAQVSRFLNIIEQLNLNTRIWTKE